MSNSKATAQKRELLQKIIFERLCAPDIAVAYDLFSREERRLIKAVTGQHFFNADGERLILSDKERGEIIAFIEARLGHPDQIKAYLQTVVPQHPQSKDARTASRKCCDWAKEKYWCDDFSICGCGTRWGGWWCDTPELHGDPHGACNRPPQCVCRCGHIASDHT